MPNEVPQMLVTKCIEEFFNGLNRFLRYLSFRGVNSVIKILNSPDDFTVIGKSTIASATSLIL